jgi:predicted ribosomally synthesized peptide with nif11-like leader
MSEQQLKAFMEAVKADEDLQSKLKAAKDTNAILAIANEAGFIFSADELEQAQGQSEDDELEAVTGGRKREVQSRQPGPSTTQFHFSRTCTN